MAAITTFESTIERAGHLVEIHKTLASRGKPPAHYSDILRAAVVLSVAAMDGYFHDLILDNVTPCIVTRNGKDLPGKLIEIIKKQASHEKLIEIFHRDRSRAHVRRLVMEELSDKTFQNVGKIEEALKIIGVDDIWIDVGKELECSKAEAKEYVQEYVERKHRIAHEGDKKKKGPGPQSITRPYAEEAVCKINDFVNAIDKVVKKKLK